MKEESVCSQKSTSAADANRNSEQVLIREQIVQSSDVLTLQLGMAVAL
jgi:hypothetical protein